MRLLITTLLVSTAFAAEPQPHFSVIGPDPGAWPKILSSVGFTRQDSDEARVLVLRSATPASKQWTDRVVHGAFLILEGESPAAESFGFKGGQERIRLGSIVDARRPKLPIVWEKTLDTPRFSLPPGAQVFATERWTGAPVLAGYRRGAGAVLWVAASPGEQGYERFPYLLHALADLGLEAPFRSARLWAFFDYSYRTRVDLDYFAARWRDAGIGALHVAAWHFTKPIPNATPTSTTSSPPAIAKASWFTPGLNFRMSAKNSGTIIRNGAKRPPSCRTPTSIGASS